MMRCHVNGRGQHIGEGDGDGGKGMERGESEMMEGRRWGGMLQ